MVILGMLQVPTLAGNKQSKITVAAGAAIEATRQQCLTRSTASAAGSMLMSQSSMLDSSTAMRAAKRALKSRNL